MYIDTKPVATIAGSGLKASVDTSLSSSDKVDIRTSHLEEILDSVSIYSSEERTERQVASSVLRATHAAKSEQAKGWVSYQGLKHLAGGLQGPTGAALCAIGSDIMRGDHLMISNEDAVRSGAALMDGVASYGRGIIKSTEAKTTRAVALRLKDVSAQKSVLWNFFEDNAPR